MLRIKRIAISAAILLFVNTFLAGAASASQLLSDDLEFKIKDSLAKMGTSDVKVDVNVEIPISASENPAGGPASLWATAIYHTTPDSETDSIKRPTMVLVTAYRREIMGLLRLLTFVPRGYNIVMMDLRGTGSGEGVWTSLDPVEQYDVAHLIDNWIPSQPWSNGKVGMMGGSYEGILQFLVAGLVKQEINPDTGKMEPKHLKAISPLSTLSDVYKDIAAHGGNLDMEFMLIWIAMTDMLSAMPPDLFLGGNTSSGFNLTDAKRAAETWEEHLKQLDVPISWIMNPQQEYKTSWYERRSPMIYWPKKPAGGWNLGNDLPQEVGGNSIPANLPVFNATGWFDIFTRGSLNNYQYGLSNHSPGDKPMIIGPWYHVDAAFTCTGIKGLGLIGQNDALLSWDVLVRWFDWRLKGKNDPFMQEFPVNMYVLGEEKWRAEKSWPLPASRLSDKSYYLSKDRASLVLGDWFGVANAMNNYKLVSATSESDFYNKFLWVKTPKENPVLKHDPLNMHGLSSRSAQRWFGFSPLTLVTQLSKYVFNLDLDSVSPWEDERTDEVGALTFTTEPLASDVEITGPLKLTFWAKTKFNQPLSEALIDKVLEQISDRFKIVDDSNLLLNFAEKKDVQWVVEVNDVFTDGRARNITSGWLSAAHRPFDPADPSKLDPSYQAFDPFYSHPDKKPSAISEDTLYPYVVEIWPTCNVFKKGHRIRVSISASDVPHLFPVLRPSENTIVIDENHKAKLDFKVANKNGEGSAWKWIDDISSYLMTHKN